MAKKYVSKDNLIEYDGLIKSKIDSGDSATLSSAKSYADSLASGKSDSSHTHDGRYYTESEMDAKLDVIDKEVDGSIKSLSVSGKTITYTKNDGSTGTITTQDTNTDTKVTNTLDTKAKAYITGTTSATTNTGTQVFDTGVYLSENAGELVAAKFTGTLAGNASTATKATQDASGNVITSTYETKADATTKLNTAKAYADAAAAQVKNDLLNGAGEAYDTLSELGALIDDNTDAIEALNKVAAGKADKTHSHAISDVTGLQSALDGKAATSHGTHVSYSTTAPVMDGTASAGSAGTVARSDHKHPTDTSRAAQTSLDAHTGNTTVHITATERTNWNAAKTHADSAHAPSNAEKNQNAFSNVAIGDVTIAADSATDTLTLVAGTNVTLTPDATNDKVTISAKDTIYTHPNSGVTAGTYRSVTVNAQGHVTAGSNPTTLAGYGITDAATKTHTHTVDSTLSSTSTNPVQNKVVNSAIATATSAIAANTSSIDAHSTRIENLEGKMGDGFEALISSEIAAMFTS